MMNPIDNKRVARTFFLQLNHDQQSAEIRSPFVLKLFFITVNNRKKAEAFPLLLTVITVRLLRKSFERLADFLLQLVCL